MESGKIGPERQAHMRPVIKACAFQIAVLQAEAKRAYKVQLNCKRRAKARDIACIRRNFRLDQNYAHRTESTAAASPGTAWTTTLISFAP